VESLAFVIFDAYLVFEKFYNWYLGVVDVGDLFLECVKLI